MEVPIPTPTTTRQSTSVNPGGGLWGRRDGRRRRWSERGGVGNDGLTGHHGPQGEGRGMEGFYLTYPTGKGEKRPGY